MCLHPLNYSLVYCLSTACLVWPTDRLKRWGIRENEEETKNKLNLKRHSLVAEKIYLFYRQDRTKLFYCICFILSFHFSSINFGLGKKQKMIVFFFSWWLNRNHFVWLFLIWSFYLSSVSLVFTDDNPSLITLIFPLIELIFVSRKR